MKRVLLGFLLVLGSLVIALFGALAAAPQARAAGEDSIDRLDVQAILDTSGYLHVTETIVLRFGSSSGRHGLELTLRTREPDGPDNDMVFKIDEVKVTSPSGAPDNLDLTNSDSGSRDTYLHVRVGDPNTTVSADTATYVVSYRVLGLVRSPGGIDQLYWDVTGSSTPKIVAATVKVTVPGGAQGVDCSVAVPGAKGACARSRADTAGLADFAANGMTGGQLLTVAVRIRPGLVTNNTPIQEQNAEKATQEQLALAGKISFGTLVGSVLVSLVVPFVGWRRLRRLTGDLRFEGLPPGVLPAADQSANEVRGDQRIEIPVAFGPPKLAVAEAGYLLDGTVDVRDTTATLMSLAVGGAVRLRSDSDPEVSLVDWSQAGDRPSKAMLKELFPDRKSRKSQSVDLTQRGTMAGAHEKVQVVVKEAAGEGGWFAREPSGSMESLGCGVLIQAFLAVIFVAVGAVIAIVMLGAFGVGLVLTALATLPLVLTIAITWMVVRAKSIKGQRSGIGRALTDQVQGFRTYLATAEAEQLRFEEGEDIFSKYLPWAITFDLTDRWTKVCQRLVELGRLSPAAPDWYAGSTWDLNNFSWQLNDFSSSVSSAVETPVMSSSADSGFGSDSSAFSDSGGGGGFSGGGGGGGDIGSW